MSSNAPADHQRNEQRREHLQVMSLTAWDLARAEGGKRRDPRARVMTLRTHERLRSLAEAELGVDKHQRSFLKVGRDDQPGVLLIHDSDHTPAHLVPVARALHDAGLTVHGQLLADAGHGVTGRPEARWRATLQQVRHGYRLLSGSCPEVYVLGMGFGAALAVHLAHREKVAGLVLLAPALSPRLDLTLRILNAFGLLKLPSVRRRLGARVDVLEGQREARELVGRIDVPIFGAMCDDDDVTSPEALRLLQRKSHHRRSRFVAFPAGGHDVLDAHGTASLDADIIAFIKHGH